MPSLPAPFPRPIPLAALSPAAVPRLAPAIRDPARLEALRRTALLDTAAEPAFDRLTRLASQVLGVPIALVSLVDADRQFFKSCIGLPEPWASQREAPLSHSFCQHTVTTGALLVIQDAREHPLVRDNLAVTDIGVVAYAGIPLLTPDGHVIGAFCVIDAVPRQWSVEELELLSDLAAAATTEIELRLAVAEVERQRRAHRALLDRSPDAIVTASADGRVTFWSAGAAAMFGRDEGAVLGQSLAAIMPERYRAAHVPGMRMTDGGPTCAVGYTVELHGLKPDGSEFPIELSLGHWAHGDDADHYTAVIRDITTRKALEAELTYQAFHDALTGLANRALFLDRVAHALARAPRSGRRVAVLFLDLDNFKTVNDSLGHVEGDRLLVIAARRLATCVRAGDTIARLGGDEFAVLVEDADMPGDATVLAERIIAAFTAPFPLGGSPLVATVSVGIATSVHSATPDALLRNADAAMYSAKADGKGRYAMFEPAMHVAALMRLQLDSELRQAIDANEFELEYQPIVRFDTGEITAVEALVRWRHPERGRVAPGAFIAAAEDTGIIVPLGRWVLREACMQAQRWRDAYAYGPALGVTVNLSGQQLRSVDIYDDVRAALDASGLDPARLVLEITESVLMQHTEVTLTKLRAFKSLGVRLAIDDFGTGYSSLAYLQRFPVDILKMDKTFVNGVAEGEGDAVIARTILVLAKALGLQCVAEGVETTEQRDALRALGCDYAQGYLFAPSLSADAASAMIAGSNEQRLASRLSRDSSRIVALTGA